MTRTFILQEPKHISSSIIYMSEDLCDLSQSQCDLIDRLTSVTDLFLIFPKNIIKQVNPKRFASLMNSTGYSIDESNFEVSAVIDVFKYLIEVFNGRHLNVFYINDLDSIGMFNIESDFMVIQQHQLQKCVFKSTRSPIESLKEIYKEKDYKWWEKITSKSEIESMQGMFCTHTTDDNVFFIKTNIIRNLLKDLKKTYIETFKTYSFGTFISSLFEKSGSQDILISHTVKELLEV